MATSVKRTEILPGCASNHLFIMLEIKTESVERGKGFWKCNCSLLEDKLYLDGINEILDTFVMNPITDVKEGVVYNEVKQYLELDLGMQWEVIKMKVVNFSQKYAKEKVQNKRKEMLALQDKLAKAQKKLAMINVSSPQATKHITKANIRIDKIKIQLEGLLGTLAQGVIICAKTRWYVNGEHSTKYFLSLEKHKAKNKTMTATKTHEGKITKNMNEILRLQAEFYQKLYTSNKDIKFEAQNTNSPKLTPESKDKLDFPISQEEIGKAISDMARNQSPGPDKLPVDWYKVFYSRIKQLLWEVYNYAFTVGHLHPSARRGIITLILKKSRNLLLIKSWRPISLLCCDYKIISKVISNRIKTTLQDLIHTNQSGFVQGRDATNNIRKAQDIIEYVNKKNIAAVLITVDFEKAFDRVEYDSLYKAFEFFNFGPAIITWLKMLFQDIQLCTTNAGNSSPWFLPTCGLFQGNPLGPFGYIILVELLSIRLRNNSEIQGIKIGEIVYLLSQFANDLDLYMHFNQKSWEVTISIFDWFESISGMKVNYEKTSVYRIGSIKDSNAKFYSRNKIIWTNEPRNILGSWVSNHQKDLFRLNFESLIEKAKNITSLWHHRGLSIFGKILVLNSLVSSLFIYRLNPSIKIPEEFYVVMEKVFLNFVWSGRSSKIKWELLTGLKNEGGAGLANLKAKTISLQLGWMIKNLKTEEITNLAQEAMQHELGNLVWEASLNSKDTQIYFPQENYWCKLFRTWAKLAYELQNSGAEIRNQIIWYNSNIKVGGNILNNVKMLKAGIVRIGDLLTKQEDFMTQQELECKYSVNISFTTYYGWMKAIPHEWISKLGHGQNLTNSSACEHSILSKTKKTPKIASYLYSVLNSRSTMIEDILQRWAKMGIYFQEENFRNAFQKINTLTNSVKARAFQYRLLTGSLVSNVHLKHYGIKDSDNCTFGCEERETLVHLFWQCLHIAPLIKWLSAKHTQEIKFEDFIISNFETEAINSLSLLMKNYIYITRCQENVPTIEAFKQFAIQSKKLEEIVAKSKKRLFVHERKWMVIDLG